MRPEHYVTVSPGDANGDPNLWCRCGWQSEDVIEGLTVSELIPIERAHLENPDAGEKMW